MTLIKCPECEMKISDKAFQCPHCGYPMKEDKPFTPSRSTKHKRLPNGFGQITEIKNKNLRNRFRVMITTAKTEEGKPICKLLKPRAYFSTYNEAYAALIEYNRNPYDLDSIITMQELYDRWSKEYYKDYSPGGIRYCKAAWGYCSSIYDVKVRDIKIRHLKGCIEEASIVRKGEIIEASAGVKERIKSMFNFMLDYALEYEMIDKNYARMFSLPKEIHKEIENNKTDHIAFDELEMKKLWDNVKKSRYVGYVLYMCYSGWRPTEFGLITLEDVHLDEGYIIGGIKTESGRNRKVPIHPKVRFIVEEEYKKAKEMGSNWLFNYLGDDRLSNSRLSYERYRKVFHSVMNMLHFSPDHKPHDTRKTFVTMAKKYKMDEYALKRIVGHEIDDITEAVYTERGLDWYIEEMQKIK